MISTQLEDMWLMVFGSSMVGAFAVLALFAFLCFKKKLDGVAYVYVFMPVILGITLSNTLPNWINGLLIIGIGFFWGMGITKSMSAFDSLTRIYICFLCANLALTVAGYEMGVYYYGTDLAHPVNMTQQAALIGNGGFSNSLKAWDISSALSYITPIKDFFLGSGIKAWLGASGVPDSIMIMVSIPMTVMGIYALLATFKILLDLVKVVFDMTVGLLVKALT